MTDESSKLFTAKCRYATAICRQKYYDRIFHADNLSMSTDTALLMAPCSVMRLNGKLNFAPGATMFLLDSYSHLIVNGDTTVCGNVMFHLLHHSTVTIGDGCTIGSGTILNSGSVLTLGDHVTIGENVILLDSDFHEIVLEDSTVIPRLGIETVIGNHVTIGDGAIILKNVHIGDGAEIAPGALVNKDVPANSYCAGFPAKPVNR